MHEHDHLHEHDHVCEVGCSHHEAADFIDHEHIHDDLCGHVHSELAHTHIDVPEDHVHDGLCGHIEFEIATKHIDTSTGPFRWPSRTPEVPSEPLTVVRRYETLVSEKISTQTLAAEVPNKPLSLNNAEPTVVVQPAQEVVGQRVSDAIVPNREAEFLDIPTPIDIAVPKVPAVHELKPITRPETNRIAPVRMPKTTIAQAEPVAPLPSNKLLHIDSAPAIAVIEKASAASVVVDTETSVNAEPAATEVSTADYIIEAVPQQPIVVESMGQTEHMLPVAVQEITEVHDNDEHILPEAAQTVDTVTNELFDELMDQPRKEVPVAQRPHISIRINESDSYDTVLESVALLHDERLFEAKKAGWFRELSAHATDNAINSTLIQLVGNFILRLTIVSKLVYIKRNSVHY